MTAFADRRRRLNRRMAAGSLLSIGLAIALVAIGIVALRNYTAARPTTTTPVKPALGLPVTKTALLGTVDAKGVLASLTVFVLRSNGPGGSIVSVPVNGSAGGDPEGAPQSFQTVYANDGDAAVVQAVQGELSMTFDYWLIAPADRATALFLPIAPLPVALPEAVMTTDSTSGSPKVVFKAGEHEFEAAEIVEAISSRVDNAPERLRRRTLETIWAAVATKVGNGVGTAPAAVDSIDSLVAALYAGPIGTRGLTTNGGVSDGIDAEHLDVAEATFVFASIAPSAMAAPRSGQTVRLMAPPGSEARLRDAINVLLYVQSNVLSVSLSGPQQATTQIFVTNAHSEETQALVKTFGGTIEQTDSPIEGIDINIIFGSDWLSQPPATSAPSTTAAPAASAETTPGTGG